MTQRSCLFVVLNALVYFASYAQFVDDFSDGDFSYDPTWAGTTSRWEVVERNDDLALHSIGLAQSDTIYLSVPSTAAIGRWSFSVEADGVNFSTFNGIRIYLTFDSADLTGRGSGYYVQFGTNNTDQIRLYRQNAGTGGSNNRIELGRSTEALLAGDFRTLDIAVDRTRSGQWTITANNTVVLTASDINYRESAYFGIWLKHSSSAAKAYYFDDFSVEADTVDQDTENYPPAEFGDVVINEIYYDPPANHPEFIELYNRSTKTFNLEAFFFSDDRKRPALIVPHMAILSPGSYTVVVQDGASFTKYFSGVNYIEPESWPSLNNGGDTSFLFYDNHVVDSVAYSPSWGGNGVSLERVDPDGPSRYAFNFGSSVAIKGATPCAVNSIYFPDISPPFPVFADQVSETEIEVFFSEPIDTGSIHTDSFTISGGSVVSVYQPSLSNVLLSFVGSIGGSILSVSNLQDLTGNVMEEGSVNIAWMARPRDIIINEIMFAPFTDDYDHLPNQPEYVELYNSTSSIVSLRGFYWTRRPDETGNADTLRILAGLRAVKPGEYTVVFAQKGGGNVSTEQSDLVLAFPSIYSVLPEITLVPVLRSSLSLSNTEDLVRLHRVDDTVIDEVPYSADWHHPSLRATQGVSLERINPTAPSDLAMNWSSSASRDGGTPGQVNSIYLHPHTENLKAGLVVEPSPFSPDGDGFEDIVSLNFSLNHDVSTVRVRIYDAEGRFVRTLEQARLTGRTGKLFWDGLDDFDRPLRIGVYIVLFEALDAAGGSVEIYKKPVVLARKLG